MVLECREGAGGRTAEKSESTHTVEECVLLGGSRTGDSGLVTKSLMPWEDDWTLKGFKGRQTIRSEFVDTPSGSFEEDGMEEVKLKD